MLDSALLKTNLLEEMDLYGGLVELDPKFVRNESTDTDAGAAFRCKTRIIGYHPFDTTITDEDLPWTHVLVDATSDLTG